MHSCIDGIGVSWPKRLRVELIERGAGEHVRALRLLRVRLRQEHRARAEVIAADLRRGERFGVPHVGVADDGEVVAERLERRQAASAPDRSRGRPPAGAHRFFLMPNGVLPAEPCTISMADEADLAGRARLRRRVRAGTIASSSGSAR